MAAGQIQYDEVGGVGPKFSHEPILEVFIPGAHGHITGATAVDPEYPFSPLMAMRNWIRSADFLTTCQIDFLFVEFAPYFDAWDGRENLWQELLLCAGKNFDSKFLGKIPDYYAQRIAALQDLNLGLFVHPQFTGEQNPDGWGTMHTSFIDASARFSLHDGCLVERWLSQVEKTDLNNVDGENVDDTGNWKTTTSRKRLRDLNVQTDARKTIEQICSDHNLRHRLSEDAALLKRTVFKDFEWKLELHHRIVRNIFRMREKEGREVFNSVFIAAPLRVTFANVEPTASRDDVPKSYRGGIWIFAGMKGAYNNTKREAIWNLLRLSVLTGMSSVEASASESLSEGLRRHALRTAAAAIMGRNMSHNIGSHVLARYAAEVGREDKKREHVARAGTIRDKDVEDHRAILLRYLQRRMDFIADVSTADKSFWFQPLRLVEVLDALNLSAQTERVSEKFKPILLSYITGKEGISATVDSSAIKNDPYFSCPSGEVGAHALYVILENIIRNSARHNANIANPISLKVAVREAQEYSDLWEVIIIDCQSKLAEGRKTIDEIKRIINDEILKDDGSPNPKYWGIREMQICAHYLRNLPLSDLGSNRLDPPPILTAVLCPEDGCLGYRIYLRKARLCALIVPTKGNGYDNIPSQERRRQLDARGIAILDAIPKSEILREYNFVVAPEGAHLLRDCKGSLRSPIRTFDVEQNVIRQLLDSANDENMDPERWLEPLHESLWKKYRDKNGRGWDGKSVKAVVGWEEEDFAELKDATITNDPFLHAMIGNQELANFADRNKKREICIAWIKHASAGDFGDTKSPNLASAYKTPEDVTSSIVFAEVLDSLSPHKALLMRQEKGEARGNELVAAALARVAVLDERVQSELERIYRVDLRYDVLWPCMGIWVPAKSDGTDLNNPNFEGLQNFLKRPTILKQQYPIDFLVLHLTILENLKKVRGDTCEDETLRCLLKGTRAEGCEIIVVTGRGVPAIGRHGGASDPSELQVRYLPVSALLEYLIARPSKLALMRVLWSAAAIDPTKYGRRE